MINKILDLVLRINRETELCASFDLLGHGGFAKVDIAKGKKNPDHIDYVYGWQNYVEGTGKFRVDDFGAQCTVYHELLTFLPKEKRPVTTPVENENIYDSSIPQKGENLNEYQN